MSKHEDKQRNEDEKKQQSNDQPPPGTSFSPKEPEGKHSAPESDPEPEAEAG